MLRILITLSSALLLHSCSLFRPVNSRNVEAMSNQAVLEFLKATRKLTGTNPAIGLGPQKIDPMLVQRDTYRVKGITYFPDSMGSDSLTLHYHKGAYRLTIPDSLRHKSTYLDTTGTDFVHDYALIYHFSPLYASNERGIYYIQYYSWNNFCTMDNPDIGDTCLRALTRNYLKFRVKKGKITFLEAVGLHGSTDMVSFLIFQKKELDQASPGDRITRYRIMESVGSVR